MAISLPIVSEWNPSGLNTAVNDFKKLETTGAKAAFAIKKAALPAAAAIAGLGLVAFDAVKAFAEDDAAAQKLGVTLTNVTNATDKQIQAVEDYITATSIAAAVTDDELRPAFDKLVRATGNVGKAQDLLSLALDVSAGTGKDLGSVSDALSKAFNGNFAALKKLDPALAGLIGDGADADLIFGRLASTFKNQASTAAGTAQGQFKSMSIAMGETKEAIGAALMPIIEKFLPVLQSMGNFVRDNTGLVVTLGLVIGTLAVAIIALNAGMTAYAAIQALTIALNTALTASFTALYVATGVIVIIAIIAALVALQVKFNIFGKIITGLKAAFEVWWNYVQFVWAGISGIFTTGFDGLKAVVGAWYEGVRGYLNALYNAFKTIFNSVARLWNNTIGKLSFKVPSWVPLGLGGKSFDVPDIPELANGGIVTGPTLAMIGEAGPEAVIPLNRAGGFGGNVTINVNGGDPQQVVNALRRYMQLNGSVPIRVS